jgi:hypothetical protein
MGENPKVTFSDTVKKIWKNPEGENYTVIFRRRAAFYSLDAKRDQAAEALLHSAQNGVSVTVTSDGVTSEIVDAALPGS